MSIISFIKHTPVGYGCNKYNLYIVFEYNCKNVKFNGGVTVCIHTYICCQVLRFKSTAEWFSPRLLTTCRGLFCPVQDQSFVFLRHYYLANLFSHIDSRWGKRFPLGKIFLLDVFFCATTNRNTILLENQRESGGKYKVNSRFLRTSVYE